MEQTGRCVSILRAVTGTEECHIELDEEALKSIFEKNDIANLPIMLLSVSGAFRKGKSFMLNFFLRYLKNKGYATSDWLGRDNIEDGFPWKGGKLPHTQGIMIYDQPFVVDVDGKKTAILLMDTQGLFDNNSDKKLCTQIFAFSTLISSVQVFNLSQQIQENDLECLQCFTKYALMAQTTNTCEGPPFQKLIFVVRDWQQVEDHDYGLDVTEKDDGEIGYLDSVLSCASENKELNTVRKHLKESFNDLKCFLLPHPGKKVALSGKKFPFNGEINAIDDEFLTEVQSLADFLLNPRNCVQKKIYGNVITANSLVNYAIACGRAFQAGGLPEPQTMLQASAKVMNLHLMNTCVDEFTRVMNQDCSSFLPDVDFKAICRKAQSDALRIFDENARYGDKQERDKIRANLVVRLRLQFEMYESRNQALATEIQTSVRESGDHFVRLYAAKINEETKNLILSEQKFMMYHRQHYNTCLQSFIEENKGRVGFDKALEIVKKDFDFAFQALFRQNEDKQKYIDVKTEGEKRKLQEISSQCVEYYRSELLKLLSKYSESSIVKRKHKDFTDSAVKKMYNLAKGIPTRKLEQYESDLLSRIDKEYEEAQPKMEQTKRILLMTLEGKKSEMVSVYLSMMSESIGDSYVLPDILDEQHHVAVTKLAEAMKTFDQVEQICWDAECSPTVLRYVDELKLQLDEKYRNIRENNEKNKKLYMKTKTSAFKKFFLKMFSKS